MSLVRENRKLRPTGFRKNGRTEREFLHVVSPATASEIRRTLRIRNSQVKNILRAFDAVGVKI